MTDEQQAKQYADVLKEILEQAVVLLNAARSKGFNISFQINADQQGNHQVGGIQIDRVTRLVS